MRNFMSSITKNMSLRTPSITNALCKIHGDISHDIITIDIMNEHEDTNPKCLVYVT